MRKAGEGMLGLLARDILLHQLHDVLPADGQQRPLQLLHACTCVHAPPLPLFKGTPQRTGRATH